MDQEQLDIAAAFVDELLKLKIIQLKLTFVHCPKGGTGGPMVGHCRHAVRWPELMHLPGSMCPVKTELSLIRCMKEATG
jgi:hypothetical protein